MAEVSIANVLLVRPECEIAFELHDRQDGRGLKLSLFGGRVDPGDASPLDAIVREIGEETNLSVQPDELICITRLRVPATVSRRGDTLDYHLFGAILPFGPDGTTRLNDLKAIEDGSAREWLTPHVALEDPRLTGVARFVLNTINAVEENAELWQTLFRYSSK